MIEMVIRWKHFLAGMGPLVNRNHHQNELGSDRVARCGQCASARTVWFSSDHLVRPEAFLRTDKPDRCYSPFGAPEFKVLRKVNLLCVFGSCFVFAGRMVDAC